MILSALSTAAGIERNFCLFFIKPVEFPYILIGNHVILNSN